MSYIAYKYCYSLIKNGGNLISYKAKQNEIHNVLPGFSPVSLLTVRRSHSDSATSKVHLAGFI